MQSLKKVLDCEQDEEDSSFGESSPQKCFSSRGESTPKFNSITNGVDRLKFKHINSYEPNRHAEINELDLKAEDEFSDASLGSESISEPSQQSDNNSEEEKAEDH